MNELQKARQDLVKQILTIAMDPNPMRIEALTRAFTAYELALLKSAGVVMREYGD